MSSSSSSVHQPTDNSNIIHLRIGSFNVGIEQELLEHHKSRESFLSFQDILLTCLDDVGLDVMNFCGVGGPKKGIRAAGIDPLDLEIFRRKNGPLFDVNNDYLTTWDFEELRGHTRFNIVKDATSYTLQSDFCEPEIVIHTFADDNRNLWLIQGNIVIPLAPGDTNSLSMTTRERLVRHALVTLDVEAAHDRAPQHVVQVLVGICFLTKF